MKKITPKELNRKSNTKIRATTSPASKAKKGGGKSKQKRLNQQIVDDLVDLIEGLPAFSFVFLASDGTCATGPSLISAIDLACYALEGMDYEGPYPTSSFEVEAAKAAARTPQIVKAVKKEVQRLRRAGASIILCWQAFGEKRPHLDCIGDYADGDVSEELADLLQHEIGCRLAM